MNAGTSSTRNDADVAPFQNVAEARPGAGSRESREAAGVLTAPTGSATAKPHSSTTSCTRFTQAEPSRPPAAKYVGHQAAADEAAGPLRQPGHDVEDPRDADELAGEDRERREPQHRRHERRARSGRSGAREIAGRQEPVRRGLTPDPRPDPEREQQRPDRGRPVPPPGAQSVPVTQAGGPDRRARADVGGQHGREDAAPRSVAGPRRRSSMRSGPGG